ncbi:MAG TPA: LysR family transcriptional regulator [Bordetella sp.]
MRSLDHVDLNLLRVFQAIIEEHSLTRAGARLALSQPAVSYALGRLRTLFDDPLFIRTREGMQPTAVALELSAIVARAMDALREALRYAERFDPAASRRTFRLSLSDAGEIAYLPGLCRLLAQQAPHVKLSIQPWPVGDMADALRTSKLDLVIGNLPGLVPHTRHQVLFEEDYVCVTRRRPGLPAGRKLSLAQFQSASHIRVNSPENSHYALDETLRARGVARHIALELPHFVVLPKVLAVTDLFVILPRRLAHVLDDGGLFQLYALPFPLPAAQVTMHWHEQFEAEDGLAWLRSLVEGLVDEFDLSSRR